MKVLLGGSVTNDTINARERRYMKIIFLITLILPPSKKPLRVILL